MKILLSALLACVTFTVTASSKANKDLQDYASERLNIYTAVNLTASLSHLSQNQKKMIAVLIDASDVMNGLFW